jgi:hypothetical protein
MLQKQENVIRKIGKQNTEVMTTEVMTTEVMTTGVMR